MSPLITPLVLTLANVFLYLRHPRPVARYVSVHGRAPNVADPRSYTERILWRKLVDRNPLFVRASDKLACKDHIRSVCPDLPLPETLWVGDDSDNIPARLFDRVVFVKANHGCNFNFPVRSGEPDRAELKRLTEKWLGATYALRQGEWAYSQVRPRLFVEESVSAIGKGLIEFTVRAADGRPIIGSVIGRAKTPDQWSVYLDLEGRPIPGPKGGVGTLPSGLDIREPYRRAVAFTRRLGKGFDYARFDFLWNGETLFGGEITIYPGGGISELHDSAFRSAVLESWRLQDSHFLRTRRGGLSGVYAMALLRRLEQRRVASLDREVDTPRQ